MHTEGEVQCHQSDLVRVCSVGLQLSSSRSCRSERVPDDGPGNVCRQREEALWKSKQAHKSVTCAAFRFEDSRARRGGVLVRG